MSGWRALPRQYPVILCRALDLLLLRGYLPQQLELPPPGACAGSLGRVLGVHCCGGHWPRVLHHVCAGDQAQDPGGDRETLQVRPHPAHHCLRISYIFGFSVKVTVGRHFSHPSSRYQVQWPRMAAWSRESSVPLTKKTICDWRTDLRGPLVTNKWDRILRCYLFQKTGPCEKQSLSSIAIMSF